MQAFGWLQNQTRETIRVVVAIAVLVASATGPFEGLDCTCGRIEWLGPHTR